MPSTVLTASAALVALGLLVFVLLKLSDRREYPEDTDGNQSVSETAADAADAVSERSWLTGAKATVATIAVAPLAIMTPLVRALPASWRLYYKLTKWSAYQLQRSSNADVVANVRRSNGKEDLLPAKWVEGGEKEKSGTGWKVKGLGEKRFDPAVHGRTSNRWGKADLIHINEDDTEQGTWIEPAIDQAIALDRERYLFRDATLEAQYNMVNAAGNGQQAIADGGENWQPHSVDVSVQRPGICEDTLVPITSRAGYDGQMVSWTGYQKIQQQQADQETVRDAKNQAWTAAKLEDIDGRDMLKIALIVGIWSFILLFHQDIGAAIASFGGGSAAKAAESATGLGYISLGGLL
jgi:preprotein translocase subunit SecG